MKIANRLADWMENHWVTPAYSGWLLGGFSLFFFIAATNTLTGWLYVLSGIGLALLAIAALLPERALRDIRIQRSAIYPVSVGEVLTVEILLENTSSRQSKTLLQVWDQVSPALAEPVSQPIESIAPAGSYRWIYELPTNRRGLYRWQTLQLRTAAPLGLFWCRRSQQIKATAVVYPTVLPLSRCPLIDQMGRDSSLQFNSDRQSQATTEGITRSLRPYRWGDPTRLVHWRSSARYGELRVREMEIFTGGQELIICLDSAADWNAHKPTTGHLEDFEQAVVAAASLFFYAGRQSLSAKLWTAGTGLVQGAQVVLEVLAAVQPGEEAQATRLPTVPIVWLTQNPASLAALPAGSRWMLWTPTNSSPAWQADAQAALINRRIVGLMIDPTKPLELQLQAPLT